MEIKKASNLQEALFLELDSVNIINSDSLKQYLRTLVAKVYMKSENLQVGFLNIYMQDKSIVELRHELEGMVYRGKNMINVDNFLNAVTNSQYNVYLEYKNKKNDYPSTALDKVIEIINGINANDRYKVSLIQDLENGNYDSLTRFVPQELINELIVMYKPVINNAEQRIMFHIRNLNVNDNLKGFLINELKKGNLDELQRFVPDELLQEYSKNMSSGGMNY